MSEEIAALTQSFKDHAQADLAHQDRTELVLKDIKDSQTKQEARFDRHLEIYAQNGKEFVALKTEVVKACEEIKAMKDSLGNKYITTDQFWPVKTLVYGMVTLMLVGMVGVWVSMALHPAPNENDIKQAVSQVIDEKVSKITQP